MRIFQEGAAPRPARLGEKSGAKFHTELHKLRKTGEPQVPRWRSVTQMYLADVKPAETKKAVANADFVPRPKVVRTGTEGD